MDKLLAAVNSVNLEMPSLGLSLSVVQYMYICIYAYMHICVYVYLIKFGILLTETKGRFVFCVFCLFEKFVSFKLILKKTTDLTACRNGGRCLEQ